MSDREISKQEQYELDRHEKLRGLFGESFDAVETYTTPEGVSDEASLETAKELARVRDLRFAKLSKYAEALRKRGYTLDNDDSVPVTPTPSGDVAEGDVPDLSDADLEELTAPEAEVAA